MITAEQLKKKNNNELITLLNKSVDICEGFKSKLLGYLDKMEQADIEYEQIIETITKSGSKLNEQDNVDLILINNKIEECSVLIKKYNLKLEKEESNYGIILIELDRRVNGTI